MRAPVGVDTWYYTFVVDYTSASEGSVNFFARLSAGAHNFTGSSLALKGLLNGSPSPGVLQIAKPGAEPGNPDLAITSPQFGKITSAVSPRTGQVGLRLTF